MVQTSGAAHEPIGFTDPLTATTTVMDNLKIIVRPTGIEIPKHDKLEIDLLDRKGTARILTYLLQNLDSPFRMWTD